MGSAVSLSWRWVCRLKIAQRGLLCAASVLGAGLALGSSAIGAASQAHAQQGQDQAAAPGTLRPPQVSHRVDAIYPPGATLAPGSAASVQLEVTVDIQGMPTQIAVRQSAGQALDDAAIAALKQWRFFPALQAGQPVASRILVPFEFAVPQAAPAPGQGSPGSAPGQDSSGSAPSQGSSSAADSQNPSSAAGSQSPSGSAPSQGSSSAADSQNPSSAADAQDPSSRAGAQGLSDSEEPVLEIDVIGTRQTRPPRAASDLRIGRDVLAAAPKSEGAQVLSAAPGLTMGRGEGMAVAHNYMLRGFDAEHGQDIEFRVGGIPVNLPFHIHGQGYSDLGFLIAPVVSGLEVTEGVYDPAQGDFAVAGSIHVQLGVEEQDRGLSLTSSAGRFRSFEQTLRWAPKDGHTQSFAAAHLASSQGFGEQRAGKRASLIWQHGWGKGAHTYRALAIVSAASAALAGVLRQDDIDAGLVCWTCSYPFATARAQKALGQRLMAGVFGDHQLEQGQRSAWSLWSSIDRFRIQQNFTGFIQKSQRLGRMTGRGDLIEQQNQSMSAGAGAKYRSSPLRSGQWLYATLSAGFEGRLDKVTQSQRLLDASVRNQVWDERVDATVLGADLGLYSDLRVRLGQRWRLAAGGRADFLSYDIEDRLGNLAPLDRPQNAFLPGYRRSANGLAAGPRLSASFEPGRDWSLMAAYGEGYRSPQARLLQDGQQAPFTKVRSADLGLRFARADKIELSAAGYWTSLSDDIAFEAQEGRLERMGASRRMGGVVHALWRPQPWALLSGSFTGVVATLLEPPPPTPEEPQPPFRPGQALPYVPPMVVRADLGVSPPLPWQLGGRAPTLSMGLGYSMWSRRPLPFGQFAPSVHLLDASLSAGWGPLRVGANLYNALNLKYAAVEYNFASDWNPQDGFRPRTPQRHRSVGAPLSWSVFVELSL